MGIYTLTLNPAYDVHVHTAHFEPFHENLAAVRSREAGGKGVNISRALQVAGVENTAVILMGADNGAAFRQGLEQAQLKTLLWEVPGNIRENITLHCDNGPETRISFLGFETGDEILTEIFEAMDPCADTIITMTGRIAGGMSLERVKAHLKAAGEKGARIVVDSRSFGLSDIAEVKPWLIKPNQEELSAYCREPVENMETALQKAKELAKLGICNTMVSMGEQGALLISGDRVYRASAPAVSVVSTVGAGDSAIAGFLAATARGEDPARCLATAVAFGTAACGTEGTQPPKPETVADLLPKIQVTEL